MPGPDDNETLDGYGHDDLDDIQTLVNLLELRSFIRKERRLDESLD